MSLIMSERQFTFNETLVSCILCTALLAQKMGEELTVSQKVMESTRSPVEGISLRIYK